MSVWTPEWWKWPGGRITLATRGIPAIQCGNMELRIMYIMLNKVEAIQESRMHASVRMLEAVAGDNATAAQHSTAQHST